MAGNPESWVQSTRGVGESLYKAAYRAGFAATPCGAWASTVSTTRTPTSIRPIRGNATAQNRRHTNTIVISANIFMTLTFFIRIVFRALFARMRAACPSSANRGRRV